MDAYYRRGVGAVELSAHAHLDIGAFDSVVREYIEAHLGESVDASGDTDRGALTIALDGEYLSGPTAHYGRAILTMTYRTGPGWAIVAADSIVGPYRLSRLSRLDALLNSLRAISPGTMRHLARTVRERTAEEMGREGLPYTVDWAADEPLPRELYAVLSSVGRLARGEGGGDFGSTWRLFEPPDALAARMEAVLDRSPYRFVLEPLTGTIRFFYNNGT